ncbi:MAG: glycosyltransferase [Methanomassiliicoccales archaeon]
MKLLVVQESDWLDVGVHDSHHIFERLSAEGWEITVIDYQVRNLAVKNASVFSKKTHFDDVKKVIPKGNVKVIRPAFIRMPILNYLSIPVSHYAEIRNEIVRNRPDAVIGFGIINTFILSALARRFDIPFFYYMIDELDELIPIKQLRWIGRSLIHFSVSNAKAVIVTNQGLLEYAKQMGARSEQLTMISHGVDPTMFDGVDGRAVREELGFKEDDVVLFFMGWLYDFSGLNIVADQIVSSGGNFKLLIVGKGEMSSLLNEKAEMNGNLVLIDWMPFSEMPKFIKASDVCILPFIENEITRNIVPIKIIEYLAAGKPVISTALPGIVQEFGDDGLIHYMHTPEEIMTVLKTALNDGANEIRTDRVKNFVDEQSWENKVIQFKEMVFDNITPE